MNNNDLVYLMSDIILELAEDNDKYYWKKPAEKVKTISCFCTEKNYFIEIDEDELSKIIYDKNNITLYFSLTSKSKNYTTSNELGFTLKEMIDIILDFMNLNENKQAMKSLKFYFFEGLMKFPSRDKWDICWSSF